MGKGVLAIISGFSGAGKGTVIRELLDRYEGYSLSVSATTRASRPFEKEGVDYFYKTREEFERMIREDRLLEYACYSGEYYGTPRAYVEERLEAGSNVLLEIDLQGARQVSEKYPDAIRVFITPPDIEELEARLRGRGSEDEEAIRRRLARAREEAGAIDEYDYILINDTVAECAGKLHLILQVARMRVGQNRDFIRTIQDQAAGINFITVEGK